MGAIYLPTGTFCKFAHSTSIPAMYLPARMFCTLTDTILCQFATLHAIFNLHRKFLYVGTICIPMSMISLPANKIQENEKPIYNTFFFICMRYLTCISSFYMRAHLYTCRHDLYTCRLDV